MAQLNLLTNLIDGFFPSLDKEGWRVSAGVVRSLDVPHTAGVVRSLDAPHSAGWFDTLGVPCSAKVV